MPSKGTRKPKDADKMKSDAYVWSDDEVELLLHVTNDYKVSKAMENFDWESCQSKYSDIFDAYQEQYPSKEEAESMGNMFSHSKDELTKGYCNYKIKEYQIEIQTVK